MKTKIDPDLCTSCGLCVDSCPELYDLGDEAAIVIVDTVPDELGDCALEAEENCPSEAISHE